MIFGWLVLAFGLMMTSMSSSFWQIMLSQAIAVGLAGGSLFIPSVAILPQYSKKKRALVNGIAASGSGIGGVVHPIMFRQLQLRIGFPWATRILAFVTFTTNFMSLILLRVRFKPKEKRALAQLSAFREPVYGLFCLSQFVGFSGLYNLLVYIQPYAIDNSITSERLAFYLLLILNAASTSHLSELPP